MVKIVELAETSDRSSTLILPRSKRNDEPKQKKTKLEPQEEKVKQQLEIFVDSFINEFSKRLAVYHITAKGGRLTAEALKIEIKTGTTAALVGVAVAQSLLGSLPSIVTSVRSLSSQYYLSREKAQKITKAMEQLPPGGDLSSLLSDSAVETFQSYESQFMQVTDKAGDKMAMEKLAEDAAARALNYIAETVNDNPTITNELITKAIVLGKSEKFFDPSIKNVRIRISGSILQDTNGKNVNTANLYEKTGLVVVSADTELNKFYKKIALPDSTQYGYRRLLTWEKLANGELTTAYQSEYQQEIFPKQETAAQYSLRRYEYFLQPAAIKQESKRILDKIKNRYLPIVEAPKAEQAVAKNILFDLRNPVTNFVGRKKILEELHKTLLSTQNTAVIAQAMSGLSVNSASGRVSSSAAQASVSGLGGIGKTQLALRYAETYAANYDNNILWINAETKGDLANSVNKLANKLNIEKKDTHGIEKELEEILEEIYGYFSTGKSLFIFDNVENYREFEKFLPKTLIGNKPALLITSRYRNWGNLASVIALDVLTEEESEELIKSALRIATYDQTQDRKIQELTHLLQGLPLALQQMLAYINIQRNINIEFGIQDYLELYKAKATEVLDFDIASYSHDPYAKTVFTTWQITLDKIRQNQAAGGKALEILNIMAYLCPDDIANNFFLPLEHSERLGTAIYLLKSYSMITEGSQQDKSTIHRLVQKVTRVNLEKDQHAFLEIIQKILKLTEGFTTGKEVEFHYLHFLLHMNLHVELTEALQLRATRKRVLDIITYSEFDTTRLLYLLDTAYMIYSRDEYLKFIGEALFVYTRYPFLLLLSSTINYLEARLEEGIISKEDIQKVLDYKYEISDRHYRLGRLSRMPEERERQMGAVRLVYEFEQKLSFSSEELSACSSLEKRKKRSAEVRCLRSGEESETIKKQLQYQRIKLYLQQVSQVAKLMSSGFFTKDMLSALLQGNLSTVAINFSLLASSTILGEVSNSLLTQGEILTSADEALLLGKKLSLNGKLALSLLTDEEIISAGKRRFLGKTMKVVSPFLARGTSILFAYNLKNQVQEYRAGNKAALPGIVTNGAITSIDGLESGIEGAEYLDVIQGVSEFTGPLGEAAVALIWLGSDIEHVKSQVASIEKYVHLTEEEKVIQDVRAFFHLTPSAYIDAKAANNQRVQNAIDFLKKNTQVKRYVFSTGGLSSEVFLDKKVKLTLDDTMPDDPSVGSLFCLFGRPKTHVSSSQWIPIVPYPPFMNQNDEISTYLCKNTIGVEYFLNRTESYTLIALGEGNHTVIAAADSPNIFLVSNGKINYTGGNAGNLFLLQGNSIAGMLKGGNGVNNKIKLENFNQSASGYVLIDNQGFICGKNSSDGIIAQQCESGLQIDNIQQIDGRKHKQDVIYVTEKLEFIDSYAGESNDYSDHIYITDVSNSNPKIVLRNNTVVHAFGASDRLESVNYRIPQDETGATQVELLFTEPTAQRFYFDFSLDDLNAITFQANNITFNLLSKNKTFNLIVLDPFRDLRLFHDKKMHYPDCPINAYYIFQDGTEIKLFNRNSIYAQQRSNKTVDEIVSHYPAIASRLNMALSIRLTNNETVLIGHEKHQVLYNNALAKSYLIGNGAENIYAITAATNAEKFPVPEVTLYPVHEDLTDTLDLRRLVQQSKQECPEQEISLSVSQHQQDLVITLNAHYYRVSNSCVKLTTTLSIASVRLKNTLLNNWYHNLDIILHHIPMNIIPNNNGRWGLEYSPLVFNKDKEIIALTDTELEKESEIIILKKMGQYSFIRNNDTDLMLSNALDSNTMQRDLCTIIFSQFYQASAMQEKVLSTTLTFIDQQISLKDYVEKINNATSFDDISKQYTAETYNGVLNSNTSRSARHKRQADSQVAMASKLDARVEAIADQYLDKYDHRLSKTSHTHKKNGKNQKSKSSLPIKVKNFEFTERQGIHPHPNSKQIHPVNDRIKHLPSQYPKNLKQNSQSVVTKQGISNVQSNWFTAKSDTKKLSNFYQPIKHLTDKQQLANPLISKTRPINPKFIGQQKGAHHHQRLPLSRVTAMPDITGALMVFDVFMRKATREKYQQPISKQIAKQNMKMERQLEISKAKTFSLPRPTSVEIKAHGFGLR